MSKTAKGDDGIKVVAQNKVARHDYEISQTIEAGIVLKGSEVKSVRAGDISLKESYVRPFGTDLYLIGSHIKPYAQAPAEAHSPTADRKLLLHRKEIDRLLGLVSQKGLTLLPLRVYFRGSRCKLEVGVGKGKKLHDKRQSEKQRDADRQLRRAMSVKR